jgi:glycosyltransferase involved in cell wall biosynthesis
MRQSLRIIMVHYSDFRLDSRIQRQARALAERGDTVHLVCIGEAEELRVGAGRIVVHPVPGAKPVGRAGAFVRGYARFFVHALRRVTALSLQGRVDLVEAHNMPDFLSFCGLVPKLRGTPIILNCHDTFPELFATKFERPEGDRIVKLIGVEERLSARFVDHVITVTEEARDRLADRGVGRKSSSVVMNSPDEQVFGPPRPPVPTPADGTVRVLYHGGLAPRFGVETLIRAFAESEPALARLELRVCGSGEDRNRLAAIAADVAPGRIDVAAKPVPFADIPTELERVHVGVVPTLHDDFTELLLPVKLMEYVHMGLPVVASRLPGINGYFDESHLWGFEAGSPPALARALAAVLRSPDEAQGRTRRAQASLAQIAWQHQRVAYLALVDELAARRGRRAGIRVADADPVVVATAAGIRVADAEPVVVPAAAAAPAPAA